MKKLLALCLAVVAVLCVFTGCSQTNEVDKDNGEIVVINDTKENETQNGQNDEGQTNDDIGENEQEEHNAGKVVQPITNGGDFSGGNYN